MRRDAATPLQGQEMTVDRDPPQGRVVDIFFTYFDLKSRLPSGGMPPPGTSGMSRSAFSISSLLSVLCASLVACASSPPVQPTKADFNGDWSVKWCDKTAPQSDCGGFNVSLVQDGDRICGGYDSVDSRLMQSDEGGSIHGIAVDKSAILAVESGRSGAIYLVQATLRDGHMQWKVRNTVRDADHDRSIIALDDELERTPPRGDSSEQRPGAAPSCNPGQK